MSLNDQTQYQSDDDRIRSRDLSLTSSKPPAKIDGYSIEQFLGAGAFGEVWSGTEKKTGRRVAIKFYTRRKSNDVELLAREVEKLVALAADRHVVQLLDVDWQADPPYFVMDYFEHGSLEDLLKKQNCLPVAQAEDLFREIATGLINLHGKGIFHCDLKPGNVLLDEDGKPRLADFGQARLTTESASSLGTLFFMAPEQADLNVVPAAKWDVYALGAILYCMLVGRPPYQNDHLANKLESSESVEERLEKYRKSLQSAPLPTEHRKISGVDRALADIIDRAIAPNPNRRFDSVQSVMFAMRQREDAKARRPLLVLGILGPLLLLISMSFFSWFAYGRAYNDTLSAVNNKSFESNQFAARLAANSASQRIASFFRAVEELARDPEFVSDLENAINDPELGELSQQLDDPDHNSDEAFDEMRADFRSNAACEKLQGYLNERINNEFDRFPEAASWFVNDARGNQLASRFKQTPATNTIGRNYSYRTYFTGMDRDLVSKNEGATEFNVAPWGVKRQVIDRSHLSAIFLSKGTSTWKVAFSVPVRDDEGEIIGIVACTSEMGSFVKFDSAGKMQYATLIDGRPGDNTGAILEHPAFDDIETNPEEIPKVTNFAQIEDSKRFRDPIAELPRCERFNKNWIAALGPVMINQNYLAAPGQDDQSQIDESGLFVLVAEDYDKVVEPVSRLGARLILLAVYAAFFFLIVATCMWLLVVRMMRDSSKRLARSFTAAGDSSLRPSSDLN